MIYFFKSYAFKKGKINHLIRIHWLFLKCGDLSKLILFYRPDIELLTCLTETNMKKASYEVGSKNLASLIGHLCFLPDQYHHVKGERPPPPNLRRTWGKSALLKLGPIQTQ